MQTDTIVPLEYGKALIVAKDLEAGRKWYDVNKEYRQLNIDYALKIVNLQEQLKTRETKITLLESNYRIAEARQLSYKTEAEAWQAKYKAQVKIGKLKNVGLVIGLAGVVYTLVKIL